MGSLKFGRDGCGAIDATRVVALEFEALLGESPGLSRTAVVEAGAQVALFRAWQAAVGAGDKAFAANPGLALVAHAALAAMDPKLRAPALGEALADALASGWGLRAQWLLSQQPARSPKDAMDCPRRKDWTVAKVASSRSAGHMELLAWSALAAERPCLAVFEALERAGVGNRDRSEVFDGLADATGAGAFAVEVFAKAHPWPALMLDEDCRAAGAILGAWWPAKASDQAAALDAAAVRAAADENAGAMRALAAMAPNLGETGRRAIIHAFAREMEFLGGEDGARMDLDLCEAMSRWFAARPEFGAADEILGILGKSLSIVLGDGPGWGVAEAAGAVEAFAGWEAGPRSGGWGAASEEAWAAVALELGTSLAAVKLSATAQEEASLAKARDVLAMCDQKAGASACKKQVFKLRI